MPIYVPGKVVLAQQQKFPAVLGEPWGGGYFAGYISHTADGSVTHALIVAPRATGATGSSYTLTTLLQWKTATTTTTGTTSPFDGAANTAAMVTAGIADHPAANFCVGLSIGGFSDWYLPSRYELDIAYFNLKPTTTANNTSWGSNIYSAPRRDLNNSTIYPAQTPLTAFNTTAEAFVAADHWSSTESSATGGSNFFFGSGQQFAVVKSGSRAVRAFRRIAL
tara:strand:- start:944 stop:1609 length:666 start_codon:yes stop_codon:yes gene_type:complete